VTSIRARLEDPESYSPSIFRKEAYVQCYEPMIYPTYGQNQWEVTNWPDILPPPIKKMPGRPKKSRNKTADEKCRDSTLVSRTGKSNKCVICKQPGHKKATCKQKNGTPSATQTGTTATRTETGTASATQTGTGTATTQTGTASATQTGTGTATTQTGTASATQTGSTSTRTETGTASATQTGTGTATTQTGTACATQTGTASATPSATQTGTGTATITQTGIATKTKIGTASKTKNGAASKSNIVATSKPPKPISQAPVTSALFNGVGTSTIGTRPKMQIRKPTS
jgi:hypothetical protein